MEDGGDEQVVDYHDWKDYREMDWLNHQRKTQNLERLAELRELEKYPLVGAHEDGRKAEGALTMSLTSWRRIENARRAGADKREGNIAIIEDPPSEPEPKKRKSRSGGTRSRLTAKAKVTAAGEALEAAQGEAVEAAAAASCALDAAQGELGRRGGVSPTHCLQGTEEGANEVEQGEEGCFEPCFVGQPAVDTALAVCARASSDGCAPWCPPS